jgi:hypothetical protein
MSDTIRLEYSSSSNITFRGTIETNISCEEWAEMRESEKDESIAEELFQLVDIYVVNDEAEGS